jgi:ankyrin repeat protein
MIPRYFCWALEIFLYLKMCCVLCVARVVETHFHLKIHFLQIILRKDESSIHRPNHAGSTPLHFAASVGYTEGAIYLIRKGADIDVKNKQKQTPLSLAPAQLKKMMGEVNTSKKMGEVNGD